MRAPDLEAIAAEAAEAAKRKANHYGWADQAAAELAELQRMESEGSPPVKWHHGKNRNGTGSVTSGVTQTLTFSSNSIVHNPTTPPTLQAPILGAKVQGT